MDALGPCKIQSANNAAPRHDSKTPPVAARVIAHFDLDAFYASVEQLENPRLAGRPVIVGGAPDGRGVVSSCSYEARARGIRTAMPLTRAYRVCPEAHFVSGRHELYRDYSQRCRQVCEQFSPTVEHTSIDEGFLDWTVEQWRQPVAGDAPRGKPDLHGPHVPPGNTPAPVHWPVDLAQKLRAAVAKELGLSISVGVGSNRLIAKIASRYAKPAGICHVRAGIEPAFLRPLPLRMAPGIGPRAGELFAASDLETFADVQNRTAADLVHAVGADAAEWLQRLARGEGSAAFHGETLAKSVSNEHTFSVDCTSQEDVRSALYRLTEKAAWRMRRAGLRAGTVGVKLRYADFQTRVRQRALGYRSDCHQELYVAASELLAMFPVRMSRWRLIGIHLSDLGETSQRQLMLFEENEPTVPRSVDNVIDLVRAKHGYRGITTAGAIARGK